MVGLVLDGTRHKQQENGESSGQECQESDNVDVEGGINVDKFELCIYRSSVLLYLNVFREPGFGENSSRNKLNIAKRATFRDIYSVSQILGSTLRRRAPKLS